MKIKLIAPEGYRYYDTLTNRNYTEVVINETERGRFELVPHQDEQIIVE